MVYSPSSVGCTYTGPYELLDDQRSFDNMFEPNPVMLIVSARSSQEIEDSETFRSKI